MPETPPATVLTVREAAAALKVCEETLRRHLRDGSIPGFDEANDRRRAELRAAFGNVSRVPQHGPVHVPPPAPTVTTPSPDKAFTLS